MCTARACVKQSVGRLVLSCLSLASSWAPPVALLTLWGATILLVSAGEVGVGAGAAFSRSGHLSHCRRTCRRRLAGAAPEVCPVCSHLRSCLHGAPGQLLGRRGDLQGHRHRAAHQREAPGTETLPKAPRGSSPSHTGPDVKFGVIFHLGLCWRQRV